jgi:hypothetical protein
LLKPLYMNCKGTQGRFLGHTWNEICLTVHVLERPPAASGY